MAVRQATTTTPLKPSKHGHFGLHTAVVPIEWRSQHCHAEDCHSMRVDGRACAVVPLAQPNSTRKSYSFCPKAFRTSVQLGPGTPRASIHIVTRIRATNVRCFMTAAAGFPGQAGRAKMAGIFISYRRQDSEGSAGRLLHTLRQHFGADRVFMDVTGIEPGADFRAEIDSWIKRCDVFIAVIGRQWLAIQKQRINDPRDYVRIETAGALQRKIPLIPVLVEGAALPGPDDLPEDLREISYRNAKELRHTSWDDDCAALIRVLEKYVTGRADASPALPERSASTGLPTKQKTGRLPWGNWFKLLAGALTAGVIGFAGYFAYTTMTVMVPRVEGHLQVDTASEVLRMTGLGVTVTRERTARRPRARYFASRRPD